MKSTTLFQLMAGAGMLTTIVTASRAECNDPKDWLKAPGPEIKVFFGYTQPHQISLEGETQGSDPAYPVPLPYEMLEKSGVGSLPRDDNGLISYYEPDGKGGFRVCRVEDWWPPGKGTPDRVNQLTAVTNLYVTQNAVLNKMPPGNLFIGATLYYYDGKGRIERVSKALFHDKNQPALDKICRRYDEKDRVILAVAPRVTKVCPTGDPDIRDYWRRYGYGEYRGEPVLLLAMGHAGALDGSWQDGYSPFRLGPKPDDPMGNAEVDSKNGVTSIWGSSMGKRDDNAANTVVDSFGHWSGSTYTFTKPPVPVEVLGGPDLLYKYARRRQTYVDGQIIKLFEYFRPNENVSRHRYYMLDGFVLRHEQLDAKGKLVRVITIEDWRQPRPGPKPDVDDKLLSTHHVALLAHQVFHRVYDIDASGKPVLVAVSWNRANRLIKGKVPIDYADLVYGTPDGKERWKTEAEFEKAFNTSSHAAHVFPEEQKKRP